MFRRDFIKMCGLGVMGLTALGSKASTTRIMKSAGVTPRGNAENLILVMLRGAPSHVDTFDLKTGAWTPGDFEAANFGNLLLPGGLFPELSTHSDKFSLLRAITGTEAVHDRAQYICETCQTYNPVFAREQPHIGSLIAMEMAASRQANDILPSFLAINGIVQGPGMLPSTHAAFTFSSENGVAGLSHPGGQELFDKRWQSLQNIDKQDRTPSAPIGNAVSDYHNFYALGRQLMYEPDAEEVFSITDEEITRYGESSVGAGCAIAVKAIARNRGTRVVQVNHGSWDMHNDIYNRNIGGNIYDLSGQLDKALAGTLQDLANKPGKRGGTLLDETMVVAVGEFGRTPGALTNDNGRDHYPGAWAALVAGGGVAANQAFGATDPEGYYITDPFWSQNRFITIHDLIATVYSSLGIDWTTEIRDTPSGRVYEYTPKVEGEAGYYKDIVEMFG